MTRITARLEPPPTNPEREHQRLPDWAVSAISFISFEPSMTVGKEMESSERLGLSLEMAFRFLKENRNPDGLWSDFLTLAGESVYWVTGYVGYAASRNRAPGETEEWLEEVGSRVLEHQGGDGGWGYGPGVPSDADSTAWCLLFLSRRGMQGQESRERALRFLSRHQSPLDGGFRTYAAPREVGRYMMLDGSVSFDGWSSSQTCVTGAAARALIETASPQGLDAALDYIRSSQTAEGCWNSYWWADRLYATVNCMKALGSCGGIGREEDEPALDRARAWILRTQLPDGGWSPDPAAEEGRPFSTALALAGLVQGGESRVADRVSMKDGAEWLSSHQRGDGSWDHDYILRIPHPSMKEPWNQPQWKRDGKAIGAAIKDHRRLFTTATAFAALSEFQDMSSRGEI
jgi:prenyltransferase beta subunit